MPRFERLEFTGSQGAVLASRLEIPDEEPVAWALFAHCFTCGKDVKAASRIARGLAGAGVGVMRFDFTGLGNSDGDFASTNFSSNVGDLVAAADTLRAREAAPSLLVGHSLGGAAVLAAAGSIPEVRAVATIGAPFDPGHVTRLFEGRLDDIDADGAVDVQIAGRPFTIRKQFVADVSEQRLGGAIGSLRRALLVLHAPLDDIVGIDNARRIFEAARHPKSFVSLDRADHLLTGSGDADYAAAVLAAWVTRYLD